MLPNDPRHGSEAGHEQHRRDGEEACGPCDDAKLKASRRRRKRRQMGHRYTLPAGRAYDRMARWREGGASYDDLVEHTGLEESVISRVLTEGPTGTIYTRTYLAIMQAPTTMPLTTIGATRRIQALQRLGWPIERIAIEAGVHRDTILDARTPRVFVARRTRHAIADAYERLHMTVPTGETKQHRAGITRARNYAERHGWLPPMMWEDIDDAAECPVIPRDLPAHKSQHLIDHALVQRVADGEDRPRKLTRAEAEEVVRILRARGLTSGEIERFGFKPERYGKGAGNAA